MWLSCVKVIKGVITNFCFFFSGTENAYLRAWFRSQKVEAFPISLGLSFCHSG